MSAFPFRHLHYVGGRQWTDPRIALESSPDTFPLCREEPDLSGVGHPLYVALDDCNFAPDDVRGAVNDDCDVERSGHVRPGRVRRAGSNGQSERAVHLEAPR
ncbi:MAG: hypothetical protein IZT58_07200 [Actinobacteria bacterium]|nr:hypothetical protein [Actinomycetota bacterium]